MRAPEFFLGRQPIVGRNNELYGYELLFRNSKKNSALITDDVEASASVIQYAFGNLHVQDVLGDGLGFINISAQLLMSDVIELLPFEKVVLELLETVEITDEVIARCAELRKLGFKIALDDVSELEEAHFRILPLVDIVKVDVLLARPDQMHRLKSQLGEHPIKLLAEKVDTPEQKQFCLDLGFDYFQGYHFAKPVIITGKPMKPSTVVILKLISLLSSEAETREIESVMKSAPDLSMSLLNVVNSVGLGLRYKVSTIRSAITVLGRVQLQRWLQMMMYAKQSSKNSAADPLLQTASVRGHLSELLMREIQPRNGYLAGLAFLSGMLSLMDALLGRPLDEILGSLHLDDQVRVALYERKGILGTLLKLVEAAERGDSETVARLLAENGKISLEAFNRMEVQAMVNATRASV